jgi:hypothetical protein
MPITLVTMFIPIGPSCRAIGAAERNVSHISSAVPAQIAVMIARSSGPLNDVA